MKKRVLFYFLLLLIFSSCGRQEAKIVQLNDSVERVAKMAVTEYIYNDIIFVGEKKRFFGIPISKREVLFSIKIRVEAGIDLDKGFTAIPDGKIVTITLPKPEILLVDADEKSLNQYYAKYFGKKVSLLFYYNEIDAQKEIIKDDAIKRGILKGARDYTIEYFKIFYSATGYKDVVIEFKSFEKEKIEEVVDESL